MDEAAHGWGIVAWMRGVAAGAQYEALRRESVGPPMTCRRCGGIGAPWRGTRGYVDVKDCGERENCPDCRGVATGPTPAPRLPARGR